MTAAHRHGDARGCGATTIVSGQGTVFVNGQLWSVEGDENSHGEGDLISTSAGTVTIGGKKVIVIGDTAAPDNSFHFPPQDDPTAGSGSVSAYG